MFLDLALQFDRATRRVDLALGPDGDLVADTTPLTSMLVSIGSDRRAAPDDPLPVGAGETNAGVTIATRRGWCGDALDDGGRRLGSKLWLLERAKQDEITRRMAVFWLEEALAWALEWVGTAAEVEAEWVRDQVLGFRCFVADTELRLSRGAA